MTPYGAPNPPRGPGVAPPFGAPPTDRDAKTIWVRVGVSTLVLVLSCLAGSAGIGVVLAASRQLEVRAQDLVGDYLGALRSDEYRTAYGLLCETATRGTSLESFTTRERQRPITQYSVQDVRSGSGDGLLVGASVSYEEGPAVAHEYVVTMDGPLRICGER